MEAENKQQAPDYVTGSYVTFNGVTYKVDDALLDEMAAKADSLGMVRADLQKRDLIKLFELVLTDRQNNS